MMLWLVIALMTAAAMFCVLWPFVRRTGVARSGSDVVVYQDQLDEIERDLAAGMIGGAEAEAARIEVSRRLIAAADARSAVETGTRAPARIQSLTAAVALIALPAGAVGLYLALGSPNLAGQPFSDQVARAHATETGQSITGLITQVEKHLKENPGDGRGWEVIAPVYMRLGRYQDAVTAHSNALRLLGATALREANLGEALVNAANGIVTAQAKAAFDRALALDAKDVATRFYLGLAAEQDGRGPEAVKIWQGLLAEARRARPGGKWSRAPLRGLRVTQRRPCRARASRTWRRRRACRLTNRTR